MPIQRQGEMCFVLKKPPESVCLKATIGFVFQSIHHYCFLLKKAAPHTGASQQYFIKYWEVFSTEKKEFANLQYEEEHLTLDFYLLFELIVYDPNCLYIFSQNIRVYLILYIPFFWMSYKNDIKQLYDMLFEACPQMVLF